MRASTVATAVLVGAHSALVPALACQEGSQPETGRPKASERVVEVFDFEEPNNPLPVPRYWVRGQNDPVIPRDRPGFPAWNGGKFSRAAAHGGVQSVYLPTHGGSTSLLLRAGALPVLPGADYRISAWVRTDGLNYARAVLSVRLLDEDGHVIAGSERRSEPVLSEDEWALADVVIPANDGAYLQLEMLVLQPAQLEEPPYEFEELVTQEDVSGGAWFDDLMIVQLPQTEMSTGTPGNIAWGEQRPRIHIAVRDLTGEGLSVLVRAMSIDGREIDRVSFPFDGGRTEFDWDPSIDKYGWYRAAVEISDGQRVVGSDFVDFAWVIGPSDLVAEIETDPKAIVASGIPGGGSGDRLRFGLITRRHEPEMLAQLPEVTARLGAGSVTLPAWWELDTQDPSEQVDRMMPVVRAMRANQQSVSLMFDRLPESVAADLGVDPSDVLGLFASDEARYVMLLRPMLDRLGQMVRRWQIGEPNDTGLVWHADAVGLVRRIESEIRRPVPEAELALPWPLDLDDVPELLDKPDRVTLLHSTMALDPREVGALAENWKSASVDAMTERSVQLTLSCDDPRQFGYRACAEGFARSVIEAWAALGPRSDSIDRRGGSLAVIEPWVWTTHRRPRLMPRPEAVVLRNMVERLADRAGSSELELAPGVRSVLLEPRAGASSSRGAALAVWAEADAHAPEYLDMLLSAEDLVAYDIYGNASALPRQLVGALQLPTHRVKLGSAPVIIEGVDAELIRFSHALRLDPGMISARTGGGKHDVVLHNPWPIPIRGELYIVEPGGFGDPESPIDRSWQISPRVIPFALDADEQQAFPVTISFSPFEEAGLRDFVFDVDLTADEEYGTLRINRPVEIGVEGLRMRVSYRLGPGAGGPNVYVDADVINVGPEPVTFRLIAQASGFPRDSASITALAPSQTARRTFIFPDAAEKLSGLSAYVSLSVPDSDIRLNGSVHID